MMNVNCILLPEIGFLEYLQISVEIRYPIAPVGYWKNETIWKEVCTVHVGAVIHDYQGEGASWSIKCLWWKDCPGDLTSLTTDNVNFCTRSRPHKREASRPSGPGRGFLISFSSASHPSPQVEWAVPGILMRWRGLLMRWRGLPYPLH